MPGAWWEAFGSPELTALVNQALRSNPTTEAAAHALGQARELALAQAGTLFPTLSGAAGRAREELPQSYQQAGLPAELFSQYNAQLNLSYTLDVWGGLRRAVEQQGAAADYQRFQLEANNLSLSAGMVLGVIQAASLQDQIEAQTRLIGFEEKQLETVRRQFALGAANGTDLATQTAQVAQAHTVLLPLTTQLNQAHDQIAALLGRAPGDVAIPRFGLSMLTLPPDVPLSLPAALLVQRPDIRAAEATLHLQTAALGVAIAQRLPNVTLSAAVGTSAGDLHQLFSPTTGLWSLVTQAVQPIFDAGQLLHRQRAQAEAVRQAAALWRDTTVHAFQNVADILAALRNDAMDLRYAQQAEQAARQGLSLASLQFSLGGVSYLTVLNAEQVAQGAILTLIHARAARLSDTALLFQALGGGWWNRRDLPRPPSGLRSAALP